ncbi:enoyl-CoA hydratase/isomerase family protein [Streptomyces paludis]|uniref:Enoyl-CoA hydratase/isomerase family protein n=1 Tax=Streptomyces paludis TaxID=2282738 RepID=A0A345HY28_9ACTN|nr:enoyl-CoA hydratase/isomerase family protein [Streptomyces paludis]AXG81602.1 enoyl-CoA hydratase/isomerase family protein [Streptomyces paludis]
MTTAVLTEQSGAVRRIRLNRPESRNSINPELIQALDNAVADAMRDPGTEAVVISGNGPSFCAGADLRHLRELARAGGDPLAFLGRVSACFTRLETATKPVIAAVHGHVVAGGLELALACDAVVARTGTVIGDGHIRNGLLPGAGSSVRLPRKVGEPLARRLMLTGELLPAEHFVPSGFVQAVAEEGEFEATVTAVARSFTGLPPGQARMKRLLAAPGVPDALSRELDMFAAHWRERDIAAELDRFFDQRAVR